MEYISVEDIYNLYEKIKSGKLMEENMQYHKDIAHTLMNNYDLAFICFSSCSVEFYMWFSKDFLYELVEIINFHKKKELLLVLKHNLLEQVNDNAYDNRISNIAVVYHATYKLLQ